MSTLIRIHHVWFDDPYPSKKATFLTRVSPGNRRKDVLTKRLREELRWSIVYWILSALLFTAIFAQKVLLNSVNIIYLCRTVPFLTGQRRVGKVLTNCPGFSLGPFLSALRSLSQTDLFFRPKGIGRGGGRDHWAAKTKDNHKFFSSSCFFKKKLLNVPLKRFPSKMYIYMINFTHVRFFFLILAVSKKKV